MRTALMEGDRILVSKLRYGSMIPFTNYRLPGFSAPARGDVVVFIYPEDKSRDFIKRMVALGEETVEIKDGKIIINGNMVEDLPTKDVYYYNRGKYGQINQKVKVPASSYFVLGDNSGSSKDSRYWGFVPHDLLIGRAELIYWPPNRIRLIK